MKQSTRYSDFSLDLIPNPNTGDISKKLDANAVKQAVKNLIMLSFGEKPFHPEIGFGIKQFLFENMTPLTVTALKRHLTEILIEYEPRIKILSIDISDELDQNSIGINLVFSIVNIENPVSLTFYVERVR